MDKSPLMLRTIGRFQSIRVGLEPPLEEDWPSATWWPDRRSPTWTVKGYGHVSDSLKERP